MSNHTIKLTNNRYALRFKYHQVTEMTVFMALPQELKNGSKIIFAAETRETAGKKRMDSELIRSNFPKDVALLGEHNCDPADYVIIALK